jgi:hypothetical protein
MDMIGARRFLHIPCFITALLISILVSAPSVASIYVATYTGLLNSGIDASGVFGAAGTNLAGLMYSTSFTYDTTLGARNSCCGSDHIDGGAELGTASPIVSASITINGVTYQFTPFTRGQATTRPCPACSPDILHTAAAYLPDRRNPYLVLDETYFGADWNGAPSSLEQTVLGVTVHKTQPSGFTISRTDPSNRSLVLVYARGDYGDVAQYSVRGVAPVPELSTWFFMLIGLFSVERRYGASSSDALGPRPPRFAHQLDERSSSQSAQSAR